MLPRQAYALMLVCALGACDPDPAPSDPKCICKPTMTIEFPTVAPQTDKPTCNNATFDWMMKTLLKEVSEQKEHISLQQKQIEDLVKQLHEQESHMLIMEHDNKKLTNNYKIMAKTNDKLIEENDRLHFEKQHLEDKLELVSYSDKSDLSSRTKEEYFQLQMRGLQNQIQELASQLHEQEFHVTAIEENNKQLHNNYYTATQRNTELTEENKRLQDNMKKILETFSSDKSDSSSKIKDNVPVHIDINALKQELSDGKGASPQDCSDIQRRGTRYSGIYTIYPAHGDQGLEVFCDLNTDHGGWTLIQRRQDGSERFDNDWSSYKKGFGKIAREFWLGNENINKITQFREYELRIELLAYDGESRTANYKMFRLDSEENNYTLHIGKYAGDSGDALVLHDGRPFSTHDRDNDQSRSGNCSKLYGWGGWWFAHCYDSNLNGAYHTEGKIAKDGVTWYRWREFESLKHVEMKIRPVEFDLLH